MHTDATDSGIVEKSIKRYKNETTSMGDSWLKVDLNSIRGLGPFLPLLMLIIYHCTGHQYPVYISLSF
jgi:hypothetical protein